MNEKGGLTAPLNLCNDGTSELEKSVALVMVFIIIQQKYFFVKTKERK